MRNAELDLLQTGIKKWEKRQQPQMCLLIRVKEEGEKVSLKLNITKTKIMASGLIIAWQIEGEKVEVATYFLFLGSKITADGDFSHEIRRRLLLGRKAMTNLDSMLKTETLLCQQRSIQSRLWSSQGSCMAVKAGLRRQNAKELMPSNCGAGEDS